MNNSLAKSGTGAGAESGLEGEIESGSEGGTEFSLGRKTRLWPGGKAEFGVVEPVAKLQGDFGRKWGYSERRAEQKFLPSKQANLILGEAFKSVKQSTESLLVDLLMGRMFNVDGR